MKEMSKIKLLTAAGALLCMTVVSCKKESSGQFATNQNNQQSAVAVDSIKPCGTIFKTPLMINQVDSGGQVQVYNDANNVYVTFTSSGGWQMTNTSLYAGKCNAMPQLQGNLDPSAFPHQQAHLPVITTYTYKINKTTLDSCFCVAAYVKLVKVDNNGAVIASADAWGKGQAFTMELRPMYFNYCQQECDGCVINAGDFRTYTQGGWGARPHGNNPGVYLHKNFAAAFPGGLIIGCNKTVKFTSAQAITDYLPAGGSAAVLTQNFVNPQTVNLKNVLAAQLVTLSLSVGFDKYDANFSASTTALGSLVVTSGTFAGWSINKILDEANKVLGGCTSSYSVSQLNSALTSLNENFDNGTVNNGFVSCP